MTDTIITVTGLNKNVRMLLESGIGHVCVEGEISNMARPGSGHLYFSLKDAGAQVRCAMFKGAIRGDSFHWQNGMQVLARARVSLYEPRGDFQLIVEHLEDAGMGALQRAFELLKKELQAQGLFSPEHKKPLPAFAQTIGVVTSPSGAAIQDILHVIERRFPAAHVIIYPTLVQGKEAAPNIVSAIKLAQKHGICDVLILARGGGSLEDLWPFNEEIVARAIYACTLPTVSAVGHETDFTIADFVADYRAPTPSAAAEIVTPDGAAIASSLQIIQQQLTRAILQQLFKQEQQLKLLQKGLIHPGQRLNQYAQQCDELMDRMHRLMSHQLALKNADLQSRMHLLEQFNPKHRLSALSLRITHLQKRLESAGQAVVTQRNNRFMALIRALDALSPLAILKRGYSLTYTEDHQLVRSCTQVQPGDTLSTQLSEGILISQVLRVVEKR